MLVLSRREFKPGNIVKVEPGKDDIFETVDGDFVDH